MKETKDLYEVVGTLIRGKQSERRVKTQSGIKVTLHKKPLGYVLKNVKTKKLEVVEYLEAIERVIEGGARNAQVTVTKISNGRLIPYIRSKSGEVNLQDASMVSDPVDYVRENPKVPVTKDMQKIIDKYSLDDTLTEKGIATKSNIGDYSKKEILSLVDGLREQANK